ncbi:MAG: outer membrane beta-barrel protein [Bacteroidaceae bacterium]|nr:outer membrane beta-barrel protein [Bacteroidaceae bacterium]MBQ3622982.1 outer membrane beta-barrel protein [Bacteroidaceae bacterium]
MKAIKKIICTIMLVAAVCTPSVSKAQLSLNSYFNVDWQFNIPLSNNFSNTASGWGMNFEGGYYINPDVALGAFVSFHTNNKYFSRRTIQLNETLSMNSDQQHQMFTLPFGLLARYRFQEADFQPYISMKLGMCYAQFSNYYYIFMSDKDNWGFFMSPELGFNYYPWANGVGFHLAIYYSFATNKCDLMSYDQSNLNNIGFRLGLAF